MFIKDIKEGVNNMLIKFIVNIKVGSVKNIGRDRLL